LAFVGHFLHNRGRRYTTTVTPQIPESQCPMAPISSDGSFRNTGILETTSLGLQLHSQTNLVSALVEVLAVDERRESEGDAIADLLLVAKTNLG